MSIIRQEERMTGSKSTSAVDFLPKGCVETWHVGLLCVEMGSKRAVNNRHTHLMVLIERLLLADLETLSLLREEFLVIVVCHCSLLAGLYFIL